MTVLIRLGHYTSIYSDTGCSASESCLSCPLDRCVFDDGGASLRRTKKRAVVERAARLVDEEGYAVREAAKIMGVVERTVFRYLAEWRGVKGRRMLGSWGQCENCGGDVYRRPSEEGKRRYCSRSCWRERGWERHGKADVGGEAVVSWPSPGPRRA